MPAQFSFGHLMCESLNSSWIFFYCFRSSKIIKIPAGKSDGYTRMLPMNPPLDREQKSKIMQINSKKEERLQRSSSFSLRLPQSRPRHSSLTRLNCEHPLTFLLNHSNVTSAVQYLVSRIICQTSYFMCEIKLGICAYQ